MVADFMSTDYGWLRSLNGTKEARVLFRCGKGRDDYFTNNNICNHSTSTIDILDKYYSNKDHILVFDNAMTHLKHAEMALSARKMPKFTPKERNNWGVKVNQISADGKAIYAKSTRAQPLYFPANHQHAGVFKGRAVILEEHGFKGSTDFKAQCKDFKCPKDATHCCCHRTLYTQPIFVMVESLLEVHCKAQGYQILFLPKFHCELNFIKQCWRYAKFTRFATRSRRFMDAYSKGLTGRQAAWASKKYRGHSVLPDSLMEDLDNANLL
ncbi:hypothetical protein BS17DRAFT_798160 [Gyrodon lividus]|nr:hypothetical protein BS17DRAFT_798160 [Gyrodon lividus]